MLVRLGGDARPPPSAPVLRSKAQFASVSRGRVRLAAIEVDRGVAGTSKKKDGKDERPSSTGRHPEDPDEGDGPSAEQIGEELAADKESTSAAKGKLKSSVEQVKAIATKISAARHLARKLAEEKAALQSLDDDEHQQDLAKRQSQLNAAEAAAAAARADALARATRVKASTKGREVARLAAENQALLEVLEAASAGNPDIEAKLARIRSTFRSAQWQHKEEQKVADRAERRAALAKEAADEARAKADAELDGGESSVQAAEAPETPPMLEIADQLQSVTQSETGVEEAAAVEDVEAAAERAVADELGDVIAKAEREAAAAAAADARGKTAEQRAPESPPAAAAPADDDTMPFVRGFQDAVRSLRSVTSSSKGKSQQLSVVPTGDAAKAQTKPPLKPAPPDSASPPASDSKEAAPATTDAAAKDAGDLKKAGVPEASAIVADEATQEAAKTPEGQKAPLDSPDNAAAAPIASPDGQALQDAARGKREAKAASFTTQPAPPAPVPDSPPDDAGAAGKAAVKPADDVKGDAPSAARVSAPPAAPSPAGRVVAPPSFERPKADAGLPVHTRHPPAAPKAPPPPPPGPPPPPPLRELVKAALQRGDVIFSDVPGRPGAEVKVFYDKSGTVFAHDDNEHHMQLKLGMNRWEDIQMVTLRKFTEVPGVDSVFVSDTIKLPDELFSFDFVVQDSRTLKVDNNMGQDYRLPLKDCPTEEEVLERRVRRYEEAEEQRVAQIEADEETIRQAVKKEAREAESSAMHEWWRARRAELRAQAAAQVDRLLMGGSGHAADHIDGVFCWKEGRPSAGGKATLFYNRDSSELRHRQDLTLHIGCNNWDGAPLGEFAFRRVSGEDKKDGPELNGGDWYCVTVDVPERATVLDFVISDKNRDVWDNNHNRDFHSPVGSSSVDRAQLEEETYQGLLEAAVDQDTESANRAAKKAGERVRMRAAAQLKRRAAQRRMLYTVPLMPRAGEPVDVYYNPDVTVLRGRPEVFLRGSWNRWLHPDPIPTTRLEPAFPGGIGFLKATVQVPSDALMMDLVFLDSEDAQSGFYDNNNGLDYHVPVTGAEGSLPPLSVAHVTVEMAPIAKVGGMGDVVTALGRAVQDAGHNVEVVVPKFDCMKYDLVQDMREIRSFHWGGAHIKVFRGLVEGLPTTFLEPDNGFFWVGCIYGRNDDAHRFNFFCGAALEYLRNMSEHRPNIIHCHDWPTAPVAYGDTAGAKAVFTIHNLNYGADLVGRAMSSAAVATTVSQTYAREISGHPAVSPNLGKMFGVRNGIDVDIWDPSTDHYLPVNYDVSTFDQGKEAAKRALRQRMNLGDVDVPIIGVVTRLTHQKGIHLIKHAAWRTLERGGQFVLLGTAPDGRVQSDFNGLAGDLANQYNDRARLIFQFDEPLSHLIYAGCDMLLVPSMFEPCGLTQMIGMRYGTVPVVRKTGGLADTVFDIDDDEYRAEESGLEVNGFNFEGTDNGGLDYALNRAISTWYNDRPFFRNIARRCMTLDWSWNGPAQDYIELYYKACKEG